MSQKALERSFIFSPIAICNWRLSLIIEIRIEFAMIGTGIGETGLGASAGRRRFMRNPAAHGSRPNDNIGREANWRIDGRRMARRVARRRA
jgi:hypothetical protein